MLLLYYPNCSEIDMQLELTFNPFKTEISVICLYRT
jgi:hypothetical protein